MKTNPTTLSLTRAMFIVLPFTAAVHAQRVAVLDIEVANSVTYVFDVADANQRALDPGLVPSSPALIAPRGAFPDAFKIDDIVAVNGKPAKGVHINLLHARAVQSGSTGRRGHC
jgi:hypothetical protein